MDRPHAQIDRRISISTTQQISNCSHTVSLPTSYKAHQLRRLSDLTRIHYPGTQPPQALERSPQGSEGMEAITTALSSIVTSAASFLLGLGGQVGNGEKANVVPSPVASFVPSCSRD